MVNLYNCRFNYWKKLKTLWQKEILLVFINFSFCHDVFKSHLQQRCRNVSTGGVKPCFGLSFFSNDWHKSFVFVSFFSHQSAIVHSSMWECSQLSVVQESLDQQVRWTGLLWYNWTTVESSFICQSINHYLPRLQMWQLSFACGKGLI